MFSKAVGHEFLRIQKINWFTLKFRTAKFKNRLLVEKWLTRKNCHSKM